MTSSPRRRQRTNGGAPSAVTRTTHELALGVREKRGPERRSLEPSCRSASDGGKGATAIKPQPWPPKRRGRPGVGGRPRGGGSGCGPPEHEAGERTPLRPWANRTTSERPFEV